MGHFQMRASELFETNYLDYNVLKDFQKQRFGMINLNGDLYPTGMYGHLELFKNNPNLIPEVYEMFQDLEERIYVERGDFEDGLDDDGYGWHKFEYYTGQWKDDVNSKAMQIIYGQGWGRLGIFSRMKVRKLELECFAEHLSTLQKYAKELAEMFDVEFISNVVNDETKQNKLRLQL